MAKFKNVFTWQFTAIIVFCFTIGFFASFLLMKYIVESSRDIKEIKIIEVTTKGSSPLKIDTLSVLKLQNSIDLVAQKNDGRFEILGWGAALVIAMFVAFLTFNVIVSTGKVKEIVDEEIDKKSEKIEETLNDLVRKSTEAYNKILEISENLGENGNPNK